MATSHLTLRLNPEDVVLIERLRAQTGMSKSDLVKQALRTLAGTEVAMGRAAPGLFALGAEKFGRHGEASRQSANIKSVVRERVRTKNSA